MKKFFFSLTVLAAAVAAVSCSIIEERGAEGEAALEREVVTLSVGVTSPQTRVTGSVSEDDVKTLQVFVFADSGGLERSAYVEGSKSVEMNCYTGSKEIVAIVNAPEEISASTISNLNGTITYLEENGMADFFMYGSEQVNVVASGSVNITVARRVARFILNTVTNDISSNSSAKDLVLQNAYLINVAGDAQYDGADDYSPNEWYNKSEYDGSSGGAYGFLYDGLGSSKLNTGASYSTKHYFYCYPNLAAGRSGTTNRPTRLVVEATLDGDLWYYPVAVTDVTSNCSYEVNLTIKGAGLDSPDSDDKIFDYTFNISVAEWDTVDAIYESF